MERCGAMRDSELWEGLEGDAIWVRMVERYEGNRDVSC